MTEFLSYRFGFTGVRVKTIEWSPLRLNCTEAKFMKTIFISLVIYTSAIAPVVASSSYTISIDGPSAVTEFMCDDPCHVDQQEIVGQAGGEMKEKEITKKSKSAVTGSHLNSERSLEAKGIKCTGDCGKGGKTSQMVFEHKRTLRQGFKLDIEDGAAHIIFYSVTDTENGPATLLQHSQFRIDRPLIELNLHGHEVEIRTDLDDDNM